MRLLRYAVTILAAAAICLAVPSMAAAMISSNDTPFPSNAAITAAHWASARHGPPRNQFGDILPIAWGDDNDLYVLMDDGGTDSPKPGALWRNSFARITGSPFTTCGSSGSATRHRRRRGRRSDRNPEPLVRPVGQLLLDRLHVRRSRLLCHSGRQLELGRERPIHGPRGNRLLDQPRNELAVPLPPVPRADRQPQLGAARARRHRARRIRLRDLDRARVQREHADARAQPPRHRRHDEPLGLAVGVGLGGHADAVAGVVSSLSEAKPILTWPGT